MATKPITIKNAQISDLEFLKQLQEANGLTAAAALHKIITENQSKPQVNIEETEVYQEVNRVNQALTLELEEKNAALSGLQEENQSLLSVNRELAQEKENLESQAVNLAPADFIYRPNADEAKKMRRVLAYMISKGTIEKTAPNFPQRLTSFALNYLFENEYSHILKK